MEKMLAGPVVAGALLFGTATMVEAQEAPAQAESSNEDDSSKVGLLGLLGLAGLGGSPV